MTKAERLLRLLTILRARRTAIVARSLAELLGVSERTIYRDIQSLICSGVPVDGAAGIGYRLGTKSTLPPLTFTEDEMTALILGVRMVQGWCDDQLVSAAGTALRKICSVLPDKTLHDRERETATLLVPGLHREQTSRFSALIRQAIRQQRVLLLNYTAEDGMSTQRHVNPLGLLYWGAAWTLLGWCQLRNDHRLFRLDRINAIECQDDLFEITATQSLATYVRHYKPDYKDGILD